MKIPVTRLHGRHEPTPDDWLSVGCPAEIEVEGTPHRYTEFVAELGILGCGGCPVENASETLRVLEHARLHVAVVPRFARQAERYAHAVLCGWIDHRHENMPSLTDAGERAVRMLEGYLACSMLEED